MRRRALWFAIFGPILLACAVGGWALLWARNEAQLGRGPPVHDVSTDWRDPVMFSPALLRARGPAANPVEAAPSIAEGPRAAFLGRTVAEINRSTCPSAASLWTTAPPKKAFDRALVIARQAHLSIVDAVAPRTIEATWARWPASPSDLAIRIRLGGGGSRIDLRSISRVGEVDGGANCREVRRLRAEFARQLR